MYDPARDIFTSAEALPPAAPADGTLHGGGQQVNNNEASLPSEAEDKQHDFKASSAEPVEQSYPSRTNDDDIHDDRPVSSKVDASTRTAVLNSPLPVLSRINEEGRISGGTDPVERPTRPPPIEQPPAEKSTLPDLLTPSLPSVRPSDAKEDQPMTQLSENGTGDVQELVSGQGQVTVESKPLDHHEHQSSDSKKRKAEAPMEPSVQAQFKGTERAPGGQSSLPEKSKDAAEVPSSKRKRVAEKPQRAQRGKTPPAAYSRRDRSPGRQGTRGSPDSRRHRRTPTPPPIRRTPSPSADEPVRQRKRPGGGARIGAAEKEAIRKRQEERERERGQQTQQAVTERGVQDVVRQHYNAVPERGRDWRKTDSKIKGLRSFNNWVKSTIIQKFSPDEDFEIRDPGRQWANTGGAYPEEKRLLVLDMGCGKGGDLQKWQSAPQSVDLYVGLDPANVSIDQARDRYASMRNPRGGRGRRPQHLFQGEFFIKDCFGESLSDIPLIQQVGIDLSVGPGGSSVSSRWGGGGFDVVTMMFCMHYAFETEAKARQMLRNVAGSLKKGGRFIGVIPNSDVLTARVTEFHEKRKEKEKLAAEKKEADDSKDEAPEDGEVEDPLSEVPEWGNSIYKVRFPGDTPEDGIFRPAFGWKYSYFLEEAVEEVPEYVVPWEAFRAMTEDYNLELSYRRPFADIWNEEKDDRTLGPLSERMGVRERDGGPLRLTNEEFEAASFYHAFCFYKV